MARPLCYNPRHESVLGSGGKAPRIFDLSPGQSGRFTPVDRLCRYQESNPICQPLYWLSRVNTELTLWETADQLHPAAWSCSPGVCLASHRKLRHTLTAALPVAHVVGQTVHRWSECDGLFHADGSNCRQDARYIGAEGSFDIEAAQKTRLFFLLAHNKRDKTKQRSIGPTIVLTFHIEIQGPWKSRLIWWINVCELLNKQMTVC